ncbi:hypothetical protein [Qipengyuania sphaerica]|uniref:hypothetical protein n=1 Tax=Qipengyuania sphaerica TaxID=2867243 RepID=UPI001C87CDD5|nr:hypothetical protein [Qipengyuania sphaerica]MBX7540764.1 hypothetical protein [Qipengyuania sphaerica]
MVEPTRLSPGAKGDAETLLECKELAKYAGDGACREVLLGLCERQRNGIESTVWDIHRQTGLALHEAFAALRTLEYGKIVDIVDNPSDPFGATIRLREGGLENLRRRAAA